MIMFFNLLLRLNCIFCCVWGILYKNDLENNNFFTILKELYTLRQFCYILLAGTIFANYRGKYDVNIIITIIIIIEIIDKSIVNLIENSFKENINNIPENNLISLVFNNNNNNNKIC